MALATFCLYMRDHSLQRLGHGGRWILALDPRSTGGELLPGRTERKKIIEVTASGPDIVRRGVELQVDQVNAARESDPQSTVPLPADPASEPGRQARCPLTAHGRVQPIEWQAEIPRHRGDYLSQGSWERIRRADGAGLAIGPHGRGSDHVDVAGHPVHDAEQVQGGAAHDDDRRLLAAAGEQGAGGVEGTIKREMSVHNRPYIGL